MSGLYETPDSRSAEQTYDDVSANKFNRREVRPTAEKGHITVSTTTVIVLCVVLFAVTTVLVVGTGLIVYFLATNNGYQAPTADPQYAGKNGNDEVPVTTTQQSNGNNEVPVTTTQQSNSSSKQVAFTAVRPTGKTVNYVLTFNDLILNIGGAFNSSSGAFTAPVAGVYMFSVTLFSKSNRTSAIYCYMRKNRKTNTVRVYSEEGEFDSASQSALFHLSVGDTVDLGNCDNVKDIYNGGGHSSFSGTLIQAD